MGGWNSTLQAAWQVRHAHWARLCYVPYKWNRIYTTQLAKLSFNHSIGRTHNWRFSIFYHKYWKTSALSTTDGRLKLNFASCVIRQTRSLSVLVLCSICNIMVLVNYIYDMVADTTRTQFHKFYGRPFACVLYLFLMKYIGRWLPWVLPGSTGRFYKDDVAHNHSTHGYYNPHRGRGVRYAWYVQLQIVKHNATKL